MQADKPADKKGPAAASPNGADKTPVDDAKAAGGQGAETDADCSLPLEDLDDLPQRCADAEAKAS